MKPVTDKVFVKTLFDNFGSLIVVLLYSGSLPESKEYRSGLSTLVSLIEDQQLLAVEADADSEVRWAKELGVFEFPTVVITRTDKKIISKLTKVPSAMVVDTIERTLEAFKQQFELEKQRIIPEVVALLASKPVLIFIKGTPTNPECGFTRQFVEEMAKVGVPYHYEDIMAREELRYWVRYVGKWPTYPQLWVRGKVVGGLDVLREKMASGQLLELLKGD